MISHEGSPGQSAPLSAVADPSLSETQKPTAQDLNRFGDLISPEGYNVSTYDGAMAYMIDVHGKEPDQLRFQSAADVEEALRHEMRAAKFLDGSYQSVYEHTKAMAEIFEEEVDKRHDLKLIKPLARMMLRVHDFPEGPGEDTVINDRQALATKPYREEAGFVILQHDLGPDDPHMIALRAYNSPGNLQEKKAALFVGGIDKDEPYEFQIRPDVQAVLHRERNEDFEAIALTALRKIFDPSIFVRVQRTFAALGESWQAWGCKPFDGDPRNIVRNAAEQVLQERAAQEPNVSTMPFTLINPPVIGSHLSPEKLERAGVRLLDKKRAQRWDPSPSPALA